MLGRGLLELRLSSWWKSLRREPASFWFLCAYFFVEYFRPQTIYRSLDVIPWGRATLFLTLLAFLMEGARTRRFHAIDGFLLVFAGAWTLSVATAIYPDWAVDDAYIFVNWLLLYFLVTNIVTTERRFIVFLGFFLLWCLKLSQFAGRMFILGGFTVRSAGVWGPRGWFNNPGELAILMCVVFPIALLAVIGLRSHLARWKVWALIALLPGTIALTVVMSNSRGAQLGLVAVVLTLVAQTRYRLKGLLVASVALAGLWAIVPDHQRDRFSEMGDDRTSISRTIYWEHGIEITNNYPISGIGYRNWLPYYRTYYDPRGELPHNIFVEAGAELGYTGFLAFLLLIGGILMINRRSRRLAKRLPLWGPFLAGVAHGLDAALVGFLVSGFFVTVLYYPYFWTILAFAGALYVSAQKASRRARTATDRDRGHVADKVAGNRGPHSRTAVSGGMPVGGSR